MLSVRVRRAVAVVAAVLAVLVASGRAGSAAELLGRGTEARVVRGGETLYSALARAYQSNPQLNRERAVVRQIDEAVPQALSGYRPTVGATASVGEQYTHVESEQRSGQRVVGTNRAFGSHTPRAVGLTATQSLFNGFTTANQTRAAESRVSESRELLRFLEQTILRDAATIYMDVLRDVALLELQRNNVRVLQETLRQTRDRFNVGEVTRTDVAQSEAQLAAGQSAMFAAESTLATSRANYRRIIGADAGRLAPGMPVDRFSPRTLAAAIALGTQRHPTVIAAMYGVDVATFTVKVNEGALYPRLGLTGSVQQQWELSLTTQQLFTGSVLLTLNVPIYQGGREYSLIREAKETLGQRRLNLDQVRDQVRALVVQSWGRVEAAKAQIRAAQQQVEASEIALNGVREEARVGQRTTLDVLNAQQALVNARAALVTAQHDRVVASYQLLESVGRLGLDVLGIKVPVYDPMIHYQQVRDSWTGVRTPDGR